MTPDPASPLSEAALAARLTALARVLPYPPTPNLVAAQRRPRARRPVWVYAVALAAVAVLALLAVPSTRAGLVQFIQIGVVRLQLGPQATSTATPTPTAASVLTAAGVFTAATPATAGPALTPKPTRTLLPTFTPPPSATPLSSVLDLAGETTLADARAQVSFDIPLPSYPADLGAPDRVYLQDLDGAALVLVWLDPADPAAARLSLYLLAAPYVAEKLIFSAMKEDVPGLVVTKVNGLTAVWTTGPYVLHTQNGDLHEYRLIAGHVLIWSDGRLTYRLETDLPLADAQRIAESLEK